MLAIRTGKSSLPILYVFTHGFVDIDQKNSALSVNDRLDIENNMNYSGYFREIFSGNGQILSPIITLYA